MAINRNKVSLDVLHGFFATHSVIGQRLVKFITFARHQRLPVSSTTLTTLASTIASELIIEGFCIQWVVVKIHTMDPRATTVQAGT